MKYNLSLTTSAMSVLLGSTRITHALAEEARLAEANARVASVISSLEGSPIYRSETDDPLPLEAVDPALAEHFRLIANRQHPAVKTVAQSGARISIRLHDGRWINRIMQMPGRNEPCHCGSGRKFKRCCMAD